MGKKNWNKMEWGKYINTAVQATNPDDAHHMGKMCQVQQDEPLQRSVQECKR